MQNRKDEQVSAGFFVRLAAFLVDSILVGAATMIYRIPITIISWFYPNLFLVQNLIFQYSIVDLMNVFLTAGYFILLTYKGGATVGKKLFHIQVVSVEDRKLTLWEVLIRETVGRYLSALVLCAGYFAVGVRLDKRGLHDWFADTKVIYSHVKEVKVPTPVKHHVIPTMGEYNTATYYKPVEEIEAPRVATEEEK